jgi:hypothetical protein
MKRDIQKCCDVLYWHFGVELLSKYLDCAQQVPNPPVGGSIPPLGTTAVFKVDVAGMATGQA